jgi:hypothetical protein
MSSNRVRLRAGLILTCALTLAAPATSAWAAGATVTGDTGTATPLGGAVSIRNMAPEVAFTFDASERRYAATVTGPGGQAASIGSSCGRTSLSSPERVRYQGNGEYTVLLRVTTSEDDLSCAQATEQKFTFTINASTAVSAPATPKLLMRRPDQFSLITYDVPVDLNPGADSHELRYALNATLGPDGAITGESDVGFVNSTTGKAPVSFDRPGEYTLVVRARRGDAATAWSAPVVVTVLAPFDMLNPTFPDSRGPKYKLAGQVRETTATGKITIAIAKGKKGRKFRRLGVARIAKGGKFRLKFKLRQTGTYTLRYTFKGSPTTDAGTVVQVITITRRSFF